MATDYSTLKVTELKELLKERGIALTGLTRKQQYVEALEAQDAGTTEQGDDEADQTIGDAPGEDAANGEGDTDMKDDDRENDEIPRAGSAAPSDTSMESRKRKRKSPTPLQSEHTIQQKLESAEKRPKVKLPEDVAIEDNPAPTAAAGDDRSRDVEMAEETATDTVRSIHPATRAIYICDLIRPLQPAQLRDYIEAMAQSPSASTRERMVELFHLDSLRTHAFAVLASTNAASRVRSRLHNVVWPKEPTRKALWVDYVPEEKVQEWIDIEIGEAGSRRDTKRWEVVFEPSPDGGVVAELREASRDGSRDAARQIDTSAGNGMSNAPSAPRADRRPSAQFEARRSPEAPANVEEATPEAPNKSFNVLDERFNFTSSRPKIYFLPQPKDMVERRLRELESQTSRDWDGGRRTVHGPGAQLRRYTFDDGDVLVDGGPDFGNFGVPKNARRGGGYGGGYRGGRR